MGITIIKRAPLVAWVLTIVLAGCSNVKVPQGGERPVPKAKPISAQQQQLYEGAALEPSQENHRKFGLTYDGEGVSMPLYGNWCGLGYPKTGENPPALDLVDQACKQHDLCYEQRGQFSCSCDVELNEEIAYQLYLDSYTPNQEKLAKQLHRYFSVAPCTGTADGKLLPNSLLNRAHDFIKNNFSGTATSH